jgi:hypothetical protein
VPGRPDEGVWAYEFPAGMMFSRMSPPTLLARLSSGLTERRLRVHGLLLAVCLWGVYAYDLSTPGLLDRNGLAKGTDFVHFYVLGTLALQHRGGALYNPLLQAAIAQQIVPGHDPLYFVALYGPQVSLLFAPFARLPYGWALLGWSLLSGVIYGVCCWAVWKTCTGLRRHGTTVFILVIAYPAFFHLIAWGQTSAPALACFTLAYLALRGDRRFLAGLAIGLLIYKPQLGIVAAVVFLFSGQWSAVAGAVVSAVAELAIGWLYFGNGVMRDYLGALGHIQKVLPYLEPRPYTTHSLRSFWSMLIPFPTIAMVLYIASAMAVLAVSVAMWRSRATLALRYSVLLLATVLVAPHLTVYDLVILAPMFLLLTDWRLVETSSFLQSSHLCRKERGKDGAPTGRTLGNGSSNSTPILLYLCYALPLIGPLSKYTHVQLSVVAFVGLTVFLWNSTFAAKNVARVGQPPEMKPVE